MAIAVALALFIGVAQLNPGDPDWLTMFITRDHQRHDYSYDGGIRGLTMLLLLRAVLRRLHNGENPRHIPSPFQLFDLIAGSGTGGFIAVLLGRFCLSIETAIECWTHVVQLVITKPKSGGAYKTTALEKVLRDVLRRFCLAEDIPLLSSDPTQCKTFMLAREVDDSGNTVLRTLRSYHHPKEPAVDCTLFAAFRATMGHSAFFKPLSIHRGEHQITLLDAGDDGYNPVFNIYEEAIFLWPSRELGYLLSIGPGKADTLGGTPLRKYANYLWVSPTSQSYLQHITNCCDRTAAAFEAEWGEDLGDGKYCRLTPSNPPDDKKIRPEKEDPLLELIMPYLGSMYGQLYATVSEMQDEQDYYARLRSEM
ncbi:FabD/lysophospholipase-like protein [Schizophyllum commune H4-8]|nr:FabD/lysophospholipase-like protein [Schizophyllum commune H4-8]KAI5899437.1 FabD/lysophospholipase-like protein [Schizophyllum commune H4-8]